jgi:hypothetical protein
MGHEKWSSAHGPEAHTLYPFIARFNNKKFATPGGLPVNFGQSSCPCAYQRMKRREAINIFYKGL